MKFWPLPNSGHFICTSLKLVKVFAPFGRSCGERDKKELQNEGHQVRDETKEDVPFSSSMESFMKVFILSIIFSPERAKNSFILRHNTIENIIDNAWKGVNYNIRYAFERFFWGWKVIRTFKVPEF